MKLIVLQGPPGCGKSTWCKNYIANLDAEERKTTVVVSRDAIREMTGTYWVPEREDYITEVETYMITEALKKGYTVISDATNLNENTIARMNVMAHCCGAELKIVDLHKSFLETLERDKNREMDGSERAKEGHLSVGYDVLEGYYARYYPDEYRKEMGFAPTEREPEYHNNKH